MHVNACILLFVDVGLVERNYRGNAKLKKLSGKKKASAEIGSVHYVDYNVKMLILYIRACHTFLAGKG